jgi:hypothetical protein
MTLRRSADVSLSALLAISEEISRNVVIALVRIHLKVGTSWRKLKTMMRNVRREQKAYSAEFVDLHHRGGFETHRLNDKQ